MATKKKEAVEQATVTVSKTASPYVGQIVHYVMASEVHRAAIVTDVIDAEKGAVSVTIFVDGQNDGYSNGTNAWDADVPYNAEGEPFTWHFIEGA